MEDIRRQGISKQGIRNSDLYKDKELLSNYLDYLARPIKADASMYGTGEGFTTPIPSYTDFGKSTYDSDLGTGMGVAGDLDAIDTNRANSQGHFLKIANGTTKGLILAGTTFVNSTAGLVAGIVTSIAEGRPSGIWDNAVTLKMDEVNKWSEEALINYRSAESRDRAWYLNIFSSEWSNILGDDVIKNFGFSIGAAYAGGVYAPLLGRIAAGVIGKGWSARAAASTYYGTRVIGGSMLAAVGEGSIEAYHGAEEYRLGAKQLIEQDYQAELLYIESEDFMRLKTAELESDYNKDLKLINDYYNLLPQELVPNGEGAVANKTELERARAILNLNSRYNNKLSRVKDDAKIEALELKEKALQRAEENSYKVGNGLLAWNIGILTWSNFVQFGKFFGGGFRAQKELNKIRYTGKGEAILNKTAAAKTAEEVGEDLAGGAYDTVKDNILKKVYKKYSKNVIAEGLEEGGQGVSTKIQIDYYDTDLLNYYKALKDPDAELENLNYLNSIFNGFSKSVKDPNIWFEVIVGGITGGTGIPLIKRKKNGKIGLVVEGGMRESIREYNQREADTQSVVDKLNEIIHRPEFVKLFRGANRHIMFEKLMEIAAEEDNERLFRDSEFAQIFSDIGTFVDSGRLDDLYAIIDMISPTTNQDIKDLIENTTKTITVEQQKASIQERINNITNELLNNDSLSDTELDILNQELDELTRQLNDPAALTEIKIGKYAHLNPTVEADRLKAKEILEKDAELLRKNIDLYVDSMQYIDGLLGQNIDSEKREYAAYLKAQVLNWEERLEGMGSEVTLALRTMTSRIDGDTMVNAQDENGNITQVLLSETSFWGLIQALSKMTTEEAIQNLLKLSSDEGFVKNLLLFMESPEMLTAALYTSLDVEDVKQKFEDLGKIKKVLRDYNKYLAELIKDVYKVSKDMDKAENNSRTVQLAEEADTELEIQGNMSIRDMEEQLKKGQITPELLLEWADEYDENEGDSNKLRRAKTAKNLLEIQEAYEWIKEELEYQKIAGFISKEFYDYTVLILDRITNNILEAKEYGDPKTYSRNKNFSEIFSKNYNKAAKLIMMLYESYEDSIQSTRVPQLQLVAPLTGTQSQTPTNPNNTTASPDPVTLPDPVNEVKADDFPSRKPRRLTPEMLGKYLDTLGVPEDLRKPLRDMLNYAENLYPLLRKLKNNAHEARLAVENSILNSHKNSDLYYDLFTEPYLQPLFDKFFDHLELLYLDNQMVFGGPESTTNWSESQGAALQPTQRPTQQPVLPLLPLQPSQPQLPTLQLSETPTGTSEESSTEAPTEPTPGTATDNLLNNPGGTLPTVTGGNMANEELVTNEPVDESSLDEELDLIDRTKNYYDSLTKQLNDPNEPAPAETRPWRPNTTQYPIHRKRGDDRAYWEILLEQGKDPEMVAREKAIHTFLKDKGVFERVNNGGAPRGSKVTFAISKELTEKAGIPVVLILNDKGEIIGDLPIKNASSYPNLLKFQKQAVELYNSRKDSTNGDLVHIDGESTIRKNMIGKPLFTNTNNRNTLNTIFTDSQGKPKPFKLGIVVTRTGSSIMEMYAESGRTSSLERTVFENNILVPLNAKKGLTYLLLPTSRKVNGEVVTIPVPIATPRFGNIPTSTKLYQAVDALAIKMGTAKVLKDENALMNLKDELYELLHIKDLSIWHNYSKNGKNSDLVFKSGDTELFKIAVMRDGKPANNGDRNYLRDNIMRQLTSLSPMVNISRGYINGKIDINGVEYDYNSVIGEVAFTNLPQGATTTINEWFEINSISEGKEVKGTPTKTSNKNPNPGNPTVNGVAWERPDGKGTIIIKEGEYFFRKKGETKSINITKNHVYNILKALAYAETKTSKENRIVNTPFGWYNKDTNKLISEEEALKLLNPVAPELALDSKTTLDPALIDDAEGPGGLDLAAELEALKREEEEKKRKAEELEKKNKERILLAELEVKAVAETAQNLSKEGILNGISKYEELVKQESLLDNPDTLKIDTYNKIIDVLKEILQVKELQELARKAEEASLSLELANEIIDDALKVTYKDGTPTTKMLEILLYIPLEYLERDLEAKEWLYLNNIMGIIKSLHPKLAEAIQLYGPSKFLNKIFNTDNDTIRLYNVLQKNNYSSDYSKVYRGLLELATEHSLASKMLRDSNNMDEFYGKISTLQSQTSKLDDNGKQIGTKLVNHPLADLISGILSNGTDKLKVAAGQYLRTIFKAAKLAAIEFENNDLSVYQSAYEQLINDNESLESIKSLNVEQILTALLLMFGIDNIGMLSARKLEYLLTMALALHVKAQAMTATLTPTLSLPQAQTPSEKSVDDMKADIKTSFTSKTTKELIDLLEDDVIKQLYSLEKTSRNKILNITSRTSNKNNFNSNVKKELGKLKTTKNRLVTRLNTLSKISEALLNTSEEGGIPYTAEELNAEVKKVLKMLPQLGLKDAIRITKGLIRVVGKPGNLKAWGLYVNGMITLSNKAARGTVYHEAFHYVVDTLLSELEVKQMFEEAAEVFGEMDLLSLEEELAEAFREYMQAYEDLSYTSPNFSTLKRITNKLKGKTSLLNKLFFDIRTGKLGTRIPHATNTSSIKYKLSPYEESLLVDIGITKLLILLEELWRDSLIDNINEKYMLYIDDKRVKWITQNEQNIGIYGTARYLFEGEAIASMPSEYIPFMRVVEDRGRYILIAKREYANRAKDRIIRESNREIRRLENELRDLRRLALTRDFYKEALYLKRNEELSELTQEDLEDMEKYGITLEQFDNMSPIEKETFKKCKM